MYKEDNLFPLSSTEKVFHVFLILFLKMLALVFQVPETILPNCSSLPAIGAGGLSSETIL